MNCGCEYRDMKMAGDEGDGPFLATRCPTHEIESLRAKVADGEKCERDGKDEWTHDKARYCGVCYQEKVGIMEQKTRHIAEGKSREGDLAAALIAVIEQGSAHEDPECPEDDTCTCAIAQKVNDAISASKNAQKA